MMMMFILMVAFSGALLSAPSSVYIIEFYLASLFGKDLFVVFFWDFMSYLFCTTVMLISFSVFIYSNYYMGGDVSRKGFMFLLGGFVTSMLLLLVSPSLFTLLLGWDGLGMTSYLLVIYYSSHTSSTAGMLTFLVNRLGDSFFLLSVGFMFFFFDTEKFWGSSLLLSIFLFLALSTKSAQLPFSAWLPAAMAAPTPVSSLVHSSTLVTAGLYLMIRFSFLLGEMRFLMLLAGVFTLLAAGAMALFEWDLKKLIAFSTLSQLGFMVSAYAMGLVWLSFFHLLTHALFKASLFLSAGALIHNADNSQEFRNMFILPFQLSWVSGVVNICLLCLCGIPFTSGFYSKDLIVDGGSFTSMLFWFYLAGVGLTVVYSARFFFFSHRILAMRGVYLMAYEKVFWLASPLLILVGVAIWGGWFLFESVFSFYSLVLIASGWKSFYLIFLGVLLGVSYFLNKKSLKSYPSNFFLSSIWYLKNISTAKFWEKTVVYPLQEFLKNDQGGLEMMGPQGLFKILKGGGILFFSFQSFLFLAYFVVFLVILFML